MSGSQISSDVHSSAHQVSHPATEMASCPSISPSTHPARHSSTPHVSASRASYFSTHSRPDESSTPSFHPPSYSSVSRSSSVSLHPPHSSSGHLPLCPSSQTSVGPSSHTTAQTSAQGLDMSDTQSDMQEEDVATLRQRQEDFVGIDSQVYLSLVWHGGRISLAYYDIDTMLIHLMLDTEETDNFSILKRALHQLRPEKVVASSKQDERLVKFLKQSLSSQRVGGNGEDETEVLQFLPNIDFSVAICKRRILSMNLPTIPDHYTDMERTLYMSSLVPFENVCMVRAAGGLLKFLEKARVGVELEDTDTRVPVLGIHIFTLEDHMIIDDITYSALQIFHQEAHPSVYKSGSGAKEGLSLFGILNRCRSQIGSKMLRLWFLRPLRNVDLLKQRHAAIEFFMHARNIEVLTTLSDCLKHIKNVPRIITRMLQAQASVGDWQALYKTTYHAIYIRDLCRAQPQHIAVFNKISTCFSEALHKIATLISRIVDFEQSAVQNHFVVKTNVDPQLDEKKRTYNGLPDFMTKVAREELNRLSPDIVECNIIYLPQIGYLLAIPQTGNMKRPEEYEIEGLEFIFLSNEILHYRSASTRELDRLLGDTMCDITDHETSILHRLQYKILEHTDVLYLVMEHAAELDCLMALATCAREFNYVKPELVKDPVIDIEAGRHPLQELCCTPFVPNDLHSGGNSGKIKLLTGPNACGKSVYLKQIALIVYMAQIGSFVPAERAVIGMVDRIFTRVKSLESVSLGLSTFMLDINQMAEALRSANERSLVIVDEFGKGTETTDGLSLLCSCLKYWLAQSALCPHILMSTHFHSLVHQNMLPKSDQLQYLTLDTLHNGEELVFLYQIVEGHTTSSYASHIAAQAGLPQDVVNRGTQVSALLRECRPVHRLDTGDTTSQLKRCERMVTRFLQLDMMSDDLQSFLKDFILPVSKGKH
ncbi:mutS protein homolog 5-like [Haliotis rufescens]|uniref:mutS protein homolog 5-like n=1 Tax=Haliotis rufescens TaxID=6454 RepID=UPI00201EE065|nr:mutS protein homolog 5-like [Haliotis rufescens]XP_046326671.2 mutS protein homolog 5-like [Haliotis rufescens]XP_046326673.2 mutS protein homolog 5-like [Haliotis rufescens]